ncbi:helix-turn-helix domain-containing protein [Pelagicoccus mobilis]|uniref:Helix-turn-helix domain-containing protein n=1 Tax=Pelagicoccus mobilis TaxID=415221 RepID=A0A934VSS3_9BACT|nr:helix-turn-helix domain-containing protein [Pelagicoccus mobilis]MBK1878963.1 helix-turn-helix domain-containing protein [Pelagicoccus mobilis]
MELQHSVIPSASLELAESHPILSSLFVRSVGRLPPAVGSETRRKRGMDEFILQYCAEGVGWAENGSDRWELRPGTCIIVPPKTPHAYGAMESEPWLNYWVHFRGKQAKAFSELLGLSKGEWRVELPQDPECVAEFEMLLELYRGEIGFEQLLRASTHLRQLLQRFFVLSQRRLGGEGSKGVEAAVRYMEDHLGEKLDLARLSQVACLSRARFHELFRLEIGDTPNRYLTRLRVRRSCDLLLSTKLSLEEIALQLGFSSAFYFSRVFRQTMGMPPSAYRREW